MKNTTEIFGAIKKALGIKTDTELSKVMQVERPTLSGWKQRDSFDYKIIVEFCEKHNISLDEIFLNKENITNSNESQLKDKYIKCLEENNQLTKQVNDLIFKNSVPKPISNKSKL